ncbi:uncharacterized protein LOC119742543 [Patiria miniata]|uniref:ZMYM2-like/QRICH1 C-terminal domain-containing protein n=1 Tax=Patiria miniata TaxID=46514 RepID=A0A914BE28_PATMI|nr:uncharacterized protein LOC119742543 [Patiria miniata]
MKERVKVGLGIRRKQAEEITLEEEESLWQKQILGSSSPSQLLNTLIYLIGLNFALRGGQEHRNLRWKSPQLQILIDSNGDKFLRYTEDAFKTNRPLAQPRGQVGMLLSLLDVTNWPKLLQRCAGKVASPVTAQITLFEPVQLHASTGRMSTNSYFAK